MRRTRLQRSLRWVLAAACFSALTSGSQAGSITRECATRDVQVLMLIEAHEGPRSAFDAAEAIHALMHARIICHDGQAADALALYDSIADGMLAGPMQPYDPRR